MQLLSLATTTTRTTLLVLLLGSGASSVSANDHGLVGHAFLRNCPNEGQCDVKTSDIDLDLDDDIELIGPRGRKIICHRYQGGRGGSSSQGGAGGHRGGKRKAWYVFPT